MNPIISLHPNESIWFNSLWDKPYQRFKIENIQLRYIFIALLTIILLWFGVAYLVGLSDKSAWIIFITLNLWLGCIVYYTFPSKENQLIPLALLIVPPALSIITGIILKQNTFGIIISTIYLIIIVFYWA